MKSSTEVLRELLDERGVEWRETALGETRWLSTVLNGNASAKRINDKLVLFTGYKLITPEQAIAATLGRGTCHAEETERFECLDSRYKSFDYNPYITVHVMECSECGSTYEHVNGGYEYCPRCGRRIEVDA